MSDQLHGREAEPKPTADHIELTTLQKASETYASPKVEQYDEKDEEPVLHWRTYVALAAIFMLNLSMLVALNGPPAVVRSDLIRGLQEANFGALYISTAWLQRLGNLYSNRPGRCTRSKLDPQCSFTCSSRHGPCNCKCHSRSSSLALSGRLTSGAYMQAFASDTFQARKVLLLVPCAISVIGCAIAPGASSIYRIIVAQMLIGFGFACVPLAYSIPSEVLPRRWRPLAQSVMNAAASLGAIIGPL